MKNKIKSIYENLSLHASVGKVEHGSTVLGDLNLGIDKVQVSVVDYETAELNVTLNLTDKDIKKINEWGNEYTLVCDKPKNIKFRNKIVFYIDKFLGIKEVNKLNYNDLKPENPTIVYKVKYS